MSAPALRWTSVTATKTPELILETLALSRIAGLFAAVDAPSSACGAVFGARRDRRQLSLVLETVLHLSPLLARPSLLLGHLPPRRDQSPPPRGRAALPGVGGGASAPSQTSASAPLTKCFGAGKRCRRDASGYLSAADFVKTSGQGEVPGSDDHCRRAVAPAVLRLLRTGGGAIAALA